MSECVKMCYLKNVKVETKFGMTQGDNFYVENINTHVENYKLLGKYFHRWHGYINNTNGVAKINGMQKTKINEFIATLKNHRKDLSFDKRCENTITSKPIENFKNRYKVQNDIIQSQKEKIKKQNEIINDLKLGIIRDDVLHSIETNKNVIREIFSNCSEKVLCKAPLLKPMEGREKIMINAQKAPKLVQELQQKAIEREKYREEIIKRKRIKEEEQQKLLKEIMEKKKFLEEEEIKRNLEIINEQRKQEFKLKQLRLQKKQQIELKMLMAANFYNKSLIKQFFKKLINFYKKSRENFLLATTVFEYKEKLRIFKAWVRYVEAKYSIKTNIADAHFGLKSLKRIVTAWKELNEFVYSDCMGLPRDGTTSYIQPRKVDIITLSTTVISSRRLDCVRSVHLAEDYYDLKITIHTFVHWHRYVCKQVMIEHSKNQIAVKHNNRQLLFQYYHQWRYLPTVLQLEKSKEETKRKWREKVWEILPDFQPPEPL